MVLLHQSSILVRNTMELTLLLTLLVGVASSLITRLRFQHKAAAADLLHAQALAELNSEHARLQERLLLENRAAAGNKRIRRTLNSKHVLGAKTLVQLLKTISFMSKTVI